MLPPGIGFEWTEIAYQQQQKGTPTMLVFGAAALFVFLVLAAKYESWKLPLAVVLIVPMCLLASVTGLMFRGMPIDILAQIGFVVLVGLAAKNAILIVEFARQAQDAGSTPAEAAVSAARTRLRPILMTSLAFILGVAPLVVATGAGAEMRQSLGTAVFGGMLGVTGFGLIFTPAFYTLVQRIGTGRRRTVRATRAGPGVREPRGRGVPAAGGPLRGPHRRLFRQADVEGDRRERLIRLAPLYAVPSAIRFAEKRPVGHITRTPDSGILTGRAVRSGADMYHLTMPDLLLQISLRRSRSPPLQP